MKRSPVCLAVHGGAWNIPDNMVEAHREGVRKALLAGWSLLENGASAVEAVEWTIVMMEDDDTFNAGRGSFMNAAGEVELDAGIMEGVSLNAGAVAAVQNIRNPITLARKVMEESEHVLLVGMGATRFAREHGVTTCGKDDLITAREIERWRKTQGKRRFSLRDVFRRRGIHGDTVGAVALDNAGNIASGTSTGGTPNKHPGRVGDSPLIGCGVYADNTVGGVSTTGWGEAIIRTVLAQRVIERMGTDGVHPRKAAKDALRIMQRRVQGYGGVVAVNRKGTVGIAYNTPRMARGYMTSTMKHPLVGV